MCPSHGGAAHQVRAAAARRLEREQAEAEWLRAFRPDDGKAVDLVGDVLEELRWTAAVVRWLRSRVHSFPSNAETPEQDALVFSVERSTTYRAGQANQSHDIVRTARPNVYLQLLGEWTDRFARLAAIAGKLGIEQSYLELAEQTAGVMVDVLAAVLNDLALTPEQHEVAREAVPRHLRLVAALGEVSA